MGDDEIELHGLVRVTSPLRTALDIAAAAHFDEAVIALDSGMRTDRLTKDQLTRYFDLAHRPRVREARRALVFADELSGSVPESEARLLFARAGLPIPTTQFVVRDGDTVVALDFAWEAEQVGAEIDGFRYHSGDKAFQDDRTKQNWVQLDGWLILRFTVVDIREHPERVIAQIPPGTRETKINVQDCPRTFKTGFLKPEKGGVSSSFGNPARFLGNRDQPAASHAPESYWVVPHLLRRGRFLVAAIAAGGVIGGLAAGCSGSESAAGDSTHFVQGKPGYSEYSVTKRKAAPSLSGSTLTSTPLSIAQMRGKVVVVNFWGSWCAPCRAESAALESVAQATASKGVSFVGVDERDTRTDALSFVKGHSVTYPSIFDEDGSLAAQWPAAAGPPYTFIVDRQGRIAVRILGGVTPNELQSAVSKVAAAA